MTLFSRLKRTLFALGMVLGIAGATPAARADLDGHVFLCFRATAGDGGNTDYLVDLGLATQFTGAAGPIVSVQLGGQILNDLQNTYGADWHTRSDVRWSVSGVQKASGNGFVANTMFATKAEDFPGTQSLPIQRPSSFSAGTPAGKMQAMSTRYAQGATTAGGTQTVSADNPLALFEANTITSSYTAYQPGGVGTVGATAFAYFDATLGIENNFANGEELSVLDLYKVVPGAGDSELVGFFRMNADGTLTFRKDVSQFNIPATLSFSSDNATVAENAGTAHLTIKRNGNTTAAVSVTVNTADGTGTTAGVDYTQIQNQTVSFAAGEISKPLDVTIINRPGFQGNRSFTVTLAVSAGNATAVSPSTETVNISEVDPATPVFSFSAATYQVTEGAGTLTVTVNRAVGLSGTATVEISTVNGNPGATAGVDFTAITSQQVSFGDGVTSQNVSVTILDPAGYTGDRTFQLSLANPSSSGTIGTPNPATVTIHDNDQNPAGDVAFASATFSITAPNAAVITINRTGGTTGAGSVQLRLAAGGTLDAADITFANPTQVNFTDGQATQTVNITINANASPLPGTINLVIDTPVNVSLGTQKTATVNVAVASTPDTIKPKVKLTSPKPGKSNATFDITGTVIESDPVASIEFVLNGAAPVAITPGAASGGVTAFSVTGIPAQNGSNTLLVRAKDNKNTMSLDTKVVFTYTNSGLGLEGIYSGLIKPTAAAAPGGNKIYASGLLSVTVGKTGTFTGKVAIGGTTFVIGGVLENDGVARFKPALGTTLTLVKKGKVPVTLGNLSFTATKDVNNTTDKTITGLIAPTNGDPATSTVTARNAFYDGKTTLVDAAFLNNKGQYTGLFPSEDQTPAVDKLTYPQGDGIANVTILKTGKVTVKGKLADGTALLLTGALSKDYKVALYAQLYAKQGSIGGVVALDTTHANADADMEGDDFLWLRPAQLKPKQYVAGWPNGITVDFMAAAYVLPPKGTTASVFPFANPANGGNVQLTFDGGLLGGGTPTTVTHQAGISNKNKVTNNPATDKDFTLTLVAATGAVKGVFKHTDGTKPAYSGIIYQKGQNKGAYGFFLSNPTKNGPAGQGGGVTILEH